MSIQEMQAAIARLEADALSYQQERSKAEKMNRASQKKADELRKEMTTQLLSDAAKQAKK